MDKQCVLTVAQREREIKKVSNLGAYQWMTTTAKKVGGPINLLVLNGTLAITIYKFAEIGIKKCIDVAKSKNTNTSLLVQEKNKVYNIVSSGISNENLKFSVGEQFRVFERDGDAVLIEKIGDKNNPYFVSAELLYAISNYGRADE